MNSDISRKGISRKGYARVSLRGSDPLLTFVDLEPEDGVVVMHLVLTHDQLLTLALEALQTHKHATNPMGL